MADSLIYAPVDGRVVSLKSISESLLAGFGFEVGSFTGVALVPSDSVLLAPMAGTLIDFSSPYASFRLLSDEGLDIFVSFGFDVIDSLHDVFTPMTLEDSHVGLRTPIVRIDPDGLARSGVAPMVFVLALGDTYTVLPLLTDGDLVVGGMTPILSLSV